jgi:hypothetical protein
LLCHFQVLLYAQLRGNNQGIIKITTGGMNRAAAAAPIAIERETRLSALLNGNAQAGMLVLHRAMSMAVEKAKSAGFGIVGTNNTSTSTGALGFYAEQVAKQGLIGIVFAQSPEFVAPHGAKQAIFGTNPIAIGIPAEQVCGQSQQQQQPQLQLKRNFMRWQGTSRDSCRLSSSSSNKFERVNSDQQHVCAAVMIL